MNDAFENGKLPASRVDVIENKINPLVKWYILVVCLGVFLAGVSFGVYHVVQYNIYKDKSLFSESPELHVVGVREGVVPEDFKEKHSWTRCPENVEYCHGDYNEPIKVVHIQLRKSSKPIVLALMSYNSVLWNVIGAEQANIKEVVIGGYEAQAIRGVEKGVPLHVATHKKSLCEEGCSSLKSHFSAYDKGDEIIERGAAYKMTEEGELVEISSSEIDNRRQEIFEQERVKRKKDYETAVKYLQAITKIEKPTSFQGEYTGDVFLVGAYPDSEQIIISIVALAGVILLGGAGVLFVWLSQRRKRGESALVFLVVAGVLGGLAVPITTMGVYMGLDYWKTVGYEIVIDEVRHEGEESLADVQISDHFTMFNPYKFYESSQVQLDQSLLQCPVQSVYEIQGRKDHVFQVGLFNGLGRGGYLNVQPFTFGEEGVVAEVNGFLTIKGRDLNGGVLGVASQLSLDPFPKDVCVEFVPELQDDGTSIVLRFLITNVSTQPLSGVNFAYFVDPEIGTQGLDNMAKTNKNLTEEDRAQTIEAYTDEYGTQQGSIGNGSTDPLPDSWEIDEPGYVFGDIMDNLLIGSLDKTAAVSKDFPEDVSYALAFDLQELSPSEKAIVEIMLSVDGQSLNSFSLQHHDQKITESLTFSGRVVGYTGIASPASTPSTTLSPAI